MKSKTLILMVVAVVCGLAASYMTSRLLADRSEKVKVLVAKKRMGPWTPIKNPDEQFEIEERAKNDTPKNYVSRPEALKDHVIMKGIDKGEVLVADNLQDKNKGGLETILKPGKRAVAVRVTQESVAGGFVLPGSHVDIIHTSRRSDKDSDSRVVLQNLLVLATDLSMVKPDDRAGIVPATVTLEVSPQEALVLNKFSDVGKLTLSLRPYGDEKNVDDGTKVAQAPVATPQPDTKNGPDKVVKAPVPQPIDRKTMLVVNGSQWVRATYVTRNGETQTTFESSGNDVAVTAPAPPPPPPPASNPTTAPGRMPPASRTPEKELGGIPPSRQK